MFLLLRPMFRHATCFDTSSLSAHNTFRHIIGFEITFFPCGRGKRLPGHIDFATIQPFSSTSREKRPSQAHNKAHDGLFLDRQGEKAIRALWTQRKPAKSEQHLTFPSACRGKGLYPSKIRASWRPSPSPSGEKGKSRAVNIAGDWPFPSP